MNEHYKKFQLYFLYKNHNYIWRLVVQLQLKQKVYVHTYAMEYDLESTSGCGNFAKHLFLSVVGPRLERKVLQQYIVFLQQKWVKDR